MDIPSAPAPEVETELLGLSDRLQSLLVREQHTMRRDLARVYGLIAEAAATLTASFSVLAQHACRTSDTDAIIALQFGDIVRQLIGPQCDRSAATEDMLVALAQALVGARNLKDSRHFRQSIAECTAILNHAEKALAPSMQESPRGGTVTLF